MGRHVPHLAVRSLSGEVAPLSAGQLHHLTRVLRLSVGDEVTYTDGSGTLGRGRLHADGVVRGDEGLVPRPEPDLTMAVVPLRDRHRNRFLVEKLAELGVRRLVWIGSKFAQARSPSKGEEWASQALEQSRGAWRMEISSGILASLGDGVTACSPEGSAWPLEPPTVIAVGPEAGWHVDDLPDSCHRLSLGPRILRTETAAVVAAGLVMCGAGSRHDQ